MPTGAVYEKNVDFSRPGYERLPKNLYITTASMYNTPNFNGTIKFLADNFIKRKNSDKEIWLLGIDMDGDQEERYLFWAKYINKFASQISGKSIDLLVVVTYSG